MLVTTCLKTSIHSHLFPPTIIRSSTCRVSWDYYQDHCHQHGLKMATFVGFTKKDAELGGYLQAVIQEG